MYYILLLDCTTPTFSCKHSYPRSLASITHRPFPVARFGGNSRYRQPWWAHPRFLRSNPTVSRLLRRSLTSQSSESSWILRVESLKHRPPPLEEKHKAIRLHFRSPITLSARAQNRLLAPAPPRQSLAILPGSRHRGHRSPNPPPLGFTMRLGYYAGTARAALPSSSWLTKVTLFTLAGGRLVVAINGIDFDIDDPGMWFSSSSIITLRCVDPAAGPRPMALFMTKLINPCKQHPSKQRPAMSPTI